MPPVQAVAVGVLLAFCAASAVRAEGGGTVGELRVYPSGLILGAGWRQPLGARDEGQLTLLYNRARRGGKGRHEDERGDGAGIGMAWEHYFRDGRLGWSMSGSADLSALRIDYRDGATTGRSDITVLQPAIGVGYTFASDDNRWRWKLGASLGSEINIRTRGSKVGDGAVLLIGFSISPR